MINLIFSDIKRLRWIWLVFMAAIFINLYIGISTYHSSVQRSQAELKMHEMKGDVDILKIQTIKKMWQYPYHLQFIVFPNVILFLSLQVLVISSGLIARESEKGTLLLLLSFPMNRRKLFVSKYLTGFISLLASLILIYFFICLLTFHIGVAFSINNLFSLAVLQFMQFLAIHGYTFLSSVLFKKQLLALGASGILSFVLFRNPFIPKTGYLNTGLVLAKGTVPSGMVLLIIGSLLITFLLSLFAFERMEIGN